MIHRDILRIAIVAATLFVCAACLAQEGSEPASLDEALALAAEKDCFVIVDFAMDN